MREKCKELAALVESVMVKTRNDDFDEFCFQDLFAVQNLTSEFLESILTAIRSRSVLDSDWMFENVENACFGLCAICKNPFHHTRQTVKTKAITSLKHENVCRECVRMYSPPSFFDQVADWANLHVASDEIKDEYATTLSDAVRRVAIDTRDYHKFCSNAGEKLNTDWR